MEELLTPVSTAYKASHLKRKDALIEAHGPSMANTTSPLVSTPEEALKALRAEPDIVTLRIILKFLVYDSPSSGFRISHSSPIAAQLINALVSDVLPNYWPTFNEAIDGESPKSLNYAQERKLFLLCLRSITGLNAVLSRLKTLVLQIKEDRKQENGLKLNKTLEDFMDVLEALLSGENFITHIWNSVEGCSSTQRKALWHETVTLIGGGKLLNSAAEYSSFINEASCQISKARWVADGIKYSRWLSRNIIQWSKKLPATPQGPWKDLSNLLSRSLHLGYPGGLNLIQYTMYVDH
jgi:telomere length regulation protein